MRLHCLVLVFSLLTIGVVPTGCFSAKRLTFQTGAPAQPKTKKISAEEERAIMEQTNRLFAVGLTAEQQGDLQAAEWAYLECLQFNENRGSVKYVGPPYHRLAVITARQGKMKKSEEYFRKALELGTENVELACDFAQMLLDTDREHEAATILENALITFPKNQKLLFFLGHTLAVQSREIEALRRLKSSIGEAAAYHELAQILREKGNVHGADLMDQKGRLAQQERRRSLEKLDDSLNQELADEKGIALLTYSSKTPRLGSINRRYSEVLGDQTSSEPVAPAKVNPAEVIAKYGRSSRPQFTDAAETMFPSLPAISELPVITPELATSTVPAPAPRIPIAARSLEVEEERERQNTPTNAQTLPAPPAVPPNQRLIARPSRTVVFPPEMVIHPVDGEPTIAVLAAENGVSVDPQPIPQIIQEEAPQPLAPLTLESPRLALRETPVLIETTPVKSAEKPLETDNVNTIQEALLFEDDFLLNPMTPVLPTPEPAVEKPIGMGVEKSPLFIEVTPIRTPNIVSKQPTGIAAAAPSKQEEVVPELTVTSEIVEVSTEAEMSPLLAEMQEIQIQPQETLFTGKVELPPVERKPVPPLQTSSTIPVVPAVPQVHPLEQEAEEPLDDSDSLRLPMPQLELLAKLHGFAQEHPVVPVIPPTAQTEIQELQPEPIPVKLEEAESRKAFTLKTSAEFQSEKPQPTIRQPKPAEPESSRIVLSNPQRNAAEAKPMLKVVDNNIPQRINLTKKEETAPASKAAALRLNVSEKPVTDPKDNNKTVAFSSKTVTSTAEKETVTETVPKKLLKVQSESDSSEEQQPSRSLSIRRI